jgi:uncharacterized damage-inducible protein DinB
MAIIDPILGEMDHEARTTVRVLERVPEEKLDWTPHPKSMTLGALAWHIARIPIVARTFLESGTFDLGASRRTEIPAQTAAIVEDFQRNMTDLRALMKTLDDAALKEPMTMKRGEETIVTLPKIAAVRSILLNHTYHHRAQLALYLRLLDVPVPAIYGKSADEAI